CDYNAPLVSERFGRHMARDRFAALWRNVVALIRKKRLGRFDVVDLDKMPETIGAEANPFAALNVRAHPSNAHLATLSGDWDSFYAAKRSSATRKTERKKLRQLVEHGEVRLVHAENQEDRAQVLNVLMQQKSDWFTRMGVNNIFKR